MATVAEQVVLEPAEAVSIPVETPARSLAVRILRIFEEYGFFGRMRKFLWLSSGLFSAASFAIPFVGFVVYGSGQATSTNFLAAIISACFFGIASLLHFGPDTA